MTKQAMLETAMRQSAEDLGCRAEDFLRERPVAVPLRLGQNARRYLELPIGCSLVSYGGNIVAASQENLLQIVSEYIDAAEPFRCFETPRLHLLNDRLLEHGHKICFLAEYYLPTAERFPALRCRYAMRILGPADFRPLYLPQWSNALCEKRKELDVLGVGAFDGERLVGLAACSADCDSMWQIGVDVLPAYRRLGVASALTAALAQEILRRGKVPFYCSAWSNLASVRNAVKSGFLPAWVELTAKPVSVVDGMLR